MNSRYYFLIRLTFNIILVASCYQFTAFADTIEIKTYRSIGLNIYAGMLPEMELLAGVQTQTSWMERRGPSGKGNKYYRELCDFFLKYKDHEAIKLAEGLQQQGFSYDAPPAFILQLSPLPDLDRPEKYSDYLIGRASGEENLERFRIALRDLAQKSNFTGFYKNHAADYVKWADRALNGFKADSLSEWMADYFGWTGDEFHLVFAPAMFPYGGYGPSKEIGGKTIIYQVIRENGKSDSLPEFQSGLNLAGLSLHEFGHSFVNPSLERCSLLSKKYDLEELYTPVKTVMEKQAYGTYSTFINEMVVRAMTARAYCHNPVVYKKIMDNEKKRGFYFIEFTCEQLEYYEKNRDKYKRFDEFVPYLLKKYHSNRKSLFALLKQ